MRYLTKFRSKAIAAIAILSGLGAPNAAFAGIQGYLHVHNQTSEAVDVQVNGRWIGKVYPGRVFQYHVGHGPDKVTELYAENQRYPMRTWEKSIASALWDYNWVIE